MRDAYVDVQLEINLASLEGKDNPDEFVISTARLEADRLCERNGARLRTDRVPEILVQKGQNRETGELCLLVATRWAVVAPDQAVPTGPLGRYTGH